MYRYYQLGEKKAWVPIADKDADKVLKEVKGIKKLSILAVSEIIRDEDAKKDKDSYSYKGPLYFDIDCKEDLPLALDSGKSLCRKLVEAGVPAMALKIFASGSKGLHVIIDQHYFSSGRPVKRLPKIYKEMARELFVPGLDYQVYSQGRGNSWRLENVKRDDGNYRVPITHDELQNLTEGSYRTLCASPRTNVVPIAEPKPLKVPELEALFDLCRKRVNSKPTTEIIATDKELDLVKDEPPLCIQQIADYRGILGDKNFNEVAMQMAIYVARSGVNSTVADGILSRLADNGNSSKYDNLRAKMNHVKGQVAYMQQAPSYGFSCGSLRSLLTKPPCSGCPLENTDVGAHKGSSNGGVVEISDEYYIRGNQSDKKISNFLLEVTDIFIDVPQDGGRPRRAGVKVDMRYRGEIHAQFTMDEPSWASRSSFIKAVEGRAAKVPEVFLGSDVEVQKIKSHVMSKDPDVGEIYQVWTCGIQMDIVSNTEVFTYVEPGLSINSNKVMDTHELAGSMIARPYFGGCSLPTPGDEEVDEIMTNLLSVNRSKEIGQIIGWFVACHLKTHLTANYSQFPLLGVWGSAGSGKSATTGLVSWLNGTDYMVRDTGVNVSNITPFATIEYCASTTTIPRLMEEYNKSKMKSNSWKQVGETMKAAWNSETVLRGGIGSKATAGRTGAIVNEIPITSPLVVLSEQEIEVPALQERSLRVKLSKEIRKGRKVHFDKANMGRKVIRQVGKALMARALKTTLKDVDNWMTEIEPLLSLDIDDRPRYCHQVSMVGLKYLRSVLHDNLRLPNATEKCDNLIKVMEKQFKWLSLHVSQINARSEVDSVIEAFNIMVGQTLQGEGEAWMKEGTHILKDNDGYLYIDILLSHPNYSRYARQTLRPEDQVLVGSYKGFRELLSDEPYYVGEVSGGIMGTNANRKYVKLDIAKIADKGIDTTFFLEL